MSLCQEVGRWVTDEVVTPVETFFDRVTQQCTESSKWVEREVLTPIESWRTTQERRCREQECNWLCLCCNKWFCWLVTVLVKIVEWVIKIVGVWVVEFVCKLVVETIRVIVLVVIHIVKWVVETVVCIVDRFCLTLFLVAGMALLAALLGVVAGGIQALGPLAIPGIVAGLTAAVAALLLARVLCEISLCRILGVFAWSLKWAIVLGAVLSIGYRSIGSGFIVALCGGTLSALILMLTDKGCRVPRLLGPP